MAIAQPYTQWVREVDISRQGEILQGRKGQKCVSFIHSFDRVVLFDFGAFQTHNLGLM